MVPEQGSESASNARISAYWARLDRGWRAVMLGLAIVGVQWLRQLV